MVKANPRIPHRHSRKRLSVDQKHKSYVLLNFPSFSPRLSETPSRSTINKTSMKRSRSPSSSPPHYSPSFSCRSTINKTSMKRSRSPSSSPPHYSPSFTCRSTLPELSSLPPLPPPPSPYLLRRTVSDPVTLSPQPSSRDTLTSKCSSHSPVFRNLLRTISDPVSLLSSNSKAKNAKEKTSEEAVTAEKLSGEWIVVKFKCQCSKENHYLVNALDNKCFKLV